MASIGYHASHEQFKPSELLRYASLAAQHGFTFINSSDHFHPWSKRQGQSGFSFAWLGAAMYAVPLPFGVVCSPGQRYHPAIVAQAAATIAEMFPDRFWISVGSGEALNERITGEKWPAKAERNERLKTSVDIIRSLFRGETVTHHGVVNIEEAKLYTLPLSPPPIIGAAVTAETAEWMGNWADGLITVSAPLPDLQKVVDAFYRGGGKNKPMYLKVQLSYDKTEEGAMRGAYDQWRTNIFAGTVLADLWKVEQFDALGEMVQPHELTKMINISPDLDVHANHIKNYIDMGFEKIVLHNVNREQELFIEDFGRYILPKLNASQNKM
ncbi:TIGR03885 family FMN-dependent LLM class oxidoreductase [Pseudochryseolinea flava]|uniref:LLM class F420-dependent oxidoreductase n=1 Tax=Pseudochryseolinea flava TaxID=2059302 RepID=A0A364Y9N1_9BACT|nr:TIGR03885 family FMN-dependent LLM class oxidoreductase [Pseudochryseolinea flava]RAW02922.1 LLM class F420-dependent oxidoreductase [Pseudochryseolinea flava]